MMESEQRSSDLAARLLVAQATNTSLESRNHLLEKFMGLHVHDQGVDHTGAHLQAPSLETSPASPTRTKPPNHPMNPVAMQ